MHSRGLTFTPEKDHIRQFWTENPAVDRFWVPWAWCDVKIKQTKNNSIVIFSPDNDTMHGVRAHYDHLVTQRTELYGNLWYTIASAKSTHTWADFKQSACSKAGILRQSATLHPTEVEVGLQMAAASTLRRFQDVGGPRVVFRPSATIRRNALTGLHRALDVSFLIGSMRSRTTPPRNPGRGRKRMAT
jgi:hypothetical protein